MLDVIAGKAAIRVLRALTLFLATLPRLGLPLVLRGVSGDFKAALIARHGPVCCPAPDLSHFLPHHD